MTLRPEPTACARDFCEGQACPTVAGGQPGNATAARSETSTCGRADDDPRRATTIGGCDTAGGAGTGPRSAPFSTPCGASERAPLGQRRLQPGERRGGRADSPKVGVAGRPGVRGRALLARQALPAHATAQVKRRRVRIVMPPLELGREPLERAEHARVGQGKRRLAEVWVVEPGRRREEDRVIVDARVGEQAPAGVPGALAKVVDPARRDLDRGNLGLVVGGKDAELCRRGARKQGQQGGRTRSGQEPRNAPIAPPHVLGSSIRRAYSSGARSRNTSEYVSGSSRMAAEAT